MFTEPQEQTGSDDETQPLDWTPLRERTDNLDKWRLFHRPTKRGGRVWYACQPIGDVGHGVPLFTGQMGNAQYAYMSLDGADALANFQLAMAKAAA